MYVYITFFRYATIYFVKINHLLTIYTLHKFNLSVLLNSVYLFVHIGRSNIMSDVMNKKISSIMATGDMPKDPIEIKELLENLYTKAYDITTIIDSDSSDLADMYKYTLKQERIAYDNDESNVYVHAKKIDELVNEYTNIMIMVELLEKKLSALNN